MSFSVVMHMLRKSVARPGALAGSAAVLGVCAVASRPALADAKSMLPAASAVKGWKQIGAAKVYNAGNLSDLIDGGAQAVMYYTFASCAHAEYAPAGAAKPVLTIDVYDMTNPTNAYGLFGNDRSSGKPVSIGGAEGVQIASGGVDFWKGRYVVNTTIVQMSPANQAAMLTFAKAAAAKITGSTRPPALIGMLPPGYKPHTQSYQRVNIAGEGYLKNGVSARYPAAGSLAELFIAELPSAAAAKQAFARYRTDLTNPSNLAVGAKPAALKGLGESAVAVKSKFSGQIVAAQKGKYVVGVRRAKDPAAAQKLVKAAISRAK